MTAGIHEAAIIATLATTVACSSDSLDIPDFPGLAGPAARSVPQFTDSDPNALTYSPPVGIAAENALGLIGKLFRLECHDGQGNGTCPEGMRTPETVFDTTIVALTYFVQMRMQDLYSPGRDPVDSVPPWEVCAVADGGEISATGPGFSPAGSGKFVLDSEGVLDCWGSFTGEMGGGSHSLAYSKGKDGRYAYLASGVPDNPGPGDDSSLTQLYVRLEPGQDGDEPVVIALNHAIYREVDAEPLPGRILLLLNVREHAFAIKQRFGVDTLVGLGEAGMDPATGIYNQGTFVMRIFDPGNNVPDPLTFCLENGPTPAVIEAPGPEVGCSLEPAQFFDATGAAWSGVSAFLGLTPEDEEALVGFSERFQSAELLSASDLPQSFTDGFPTAITAE